MLVAVIRAHALDS